MNNHFKFSKCLNLAIGLILAQKNSLQDFLQLQKTDLEKFEKYCIRHGIAPYIYKVLQSSDNKLYTNNSIYKNFEQIYIQTLAKNLKSKQEILSLAKIFRNENITMIALKGMALIQSVYPDLGLRSMSDVDLLFDLNDIPQVEEILFSQGYQTDSRYYTGQFKELDMRQNHHHLPMMTKNGIAIEAHWNLFPPTFSYSIDLQKMKDNSIQYDAKQSKLNTFSSLDMLLHSCIHIHENYIQKGMRLAWLLDIEMLFKTDKLLMNNITRANWDNKVKDLVIKILNLKDYLFYPYQNHFVVGTEDSDFFHKNIQYLSDDKDGKGSDIIYIQSFKNRKSIFQNIKLLLQELFPRKKFLIQRYKIKYLVFIPFFYVFRIAKAIIRGLKYILLLLK